MSCCPMEGERSCPLRRVAMCSLYVRLRGRTNVSAASQRRSFGPRNDEMCCPVLYSGLVAGPPHFSTDAGLGASSLVLIVHATPSFSGQYTDQLLAPGRLALANDCLAEPLYMTFGARFLIIVT